MCWVCMHFEVVDPLAAWHGSCQSGATNRYYTRFGSEAWNGFSCVRGTGDARGIETVSEGFCMGGTGWALYPGLPLLAFSLPFLSSLLFLSPFCFALSSKDRAPFLPCTAWRYDGGREARYVERAAILTCWPCVVESISHNA